MTIAHYFPNTNQWGILTNDEFKLIDACDFEQALSDAIMHHADYIYINRFDLFKLNIVQTIDKLGFEFIYRDTLKEKVESGQVSYLINGNGHVLNMCLRDGKHTTYLYNTSNIIKSCDTELSDIGDGDTFEEKVLTGIKLIIETLNNITKCKRRFPFTIAGYARRLFKKTSGFKLLKDCNEDMLNESTTLSSEKYIRPSYSGGFVHIFGKVDKNTGYFSSGEGIVLDINSLYPYVMKYKPMPYGKAHYGEGKPSDDIIKASKNGNAYIFYRVHIAFTLKDDGIPCIKVDDDNPDAFLFCDGYLRTSAHYDYSKRKYVGKPKKISLLLTQTDLKLIEDNYNIIDIDYVNYVVYGTTKYYFQEYIDMIYPKKQTSVGVERLTYKLLLNNVSGIMAILPTHENQKIKKLDIGTTPHFSFRKFTSATATSKSYINVGSAITAYAREIIINDIKDNLDRVTYSDTDCMHLKGTEIPKDLAIGNGLGQYKLEHTFSEIYYYGKKNYAMIEDNKIKLTLAGTKLDDREYLIRTHDCLMNNKPIPDDLYDDLYLGDFTSFGCEIKVKDQHSNLRKWFDNVMEKYCQIDDPEERKRLIMEATGVNYLIQINERQWKYIDHNIAATFAKTDEYLYELEELWIEHLKREWTKHTEDLETIMRYDHSHFLQSLATTFIPHTYTSITGPFSARLYSDYTRLTAINMDLC